MISSAGGNRVCNSRWMKLRRKWSWSSSFLGGTNWEKRSGQREVGISYFPAYWES